MSLAERETEEATGAETQGIGANLVSGERAFLNLGAKLVEPAEAARLAIAGGHGAELLCDALHGMVPSL